MSLVRFFDNKKSWLLTLLIAGAVFAVFAHPVHAHAQSVIQNLDQVQTESGLGKSNIYQIVGRIIKIFFSVLGIIAISIIIYAGWTWMTAGGDTKKVETAKATLRNAVIGLLLIFASYQITVFIFNKLSGATKTGSGLSEITGDGSGVGGYGDYSGASALGKVIESHDPARDAVDVPRNRNIQVMFKIPVDPESMINTSASTVLYKTVKDASGKDVKRLAAGPLNADAVLIYPTADGPKAALKSDEVWVTFGADGANTSVVTIDPIPYLGSASQPVNYTVDLTAAIKRLQPKGTSILNGFKSPYSWKFTVGTALDNTPPRVVSVIPAANGTYDRNITVQISFSEPINLASAVGAYDGASQTFTNIHVKRADGSIVTGEWRAGAGFNVVEFTPSTQCATNSCGQKVFCLPARDTFELRAKSGVLEKAGDPQIKVQLGYSGVTDTANNALDGGGLEGQKPWSTSGGQAKGSPDDDFYLSFKTTDATKTGAPTVTSLEPIIGASAKTTPAVSLDSPVSVTFDSLMKITTFENVELRAKNPLAQAGYWKLANNITTKDSKGVATPVTKLTVQHVTFAKSQPYATIIPSSVQDIYQNCFLPASGWNPDQNLECKPGSAAGGTYSCCNGTTTDESCKLLEYGKTTK